MSGVTVLKGSWLHRELVSTGRVVALEKLVAAKSALPFAEARAKMVMRTALDRYLEAEARFNELEAEWKRLNP